MPPNTSSGKVTAEAKQGDSRADPGVTLTILDSIEKNGSLPKKGLGKRRLLRYLSRLTLEGKIQKVGYGTWELTDLGKEALKQGDSRGGAIAMGVPMASGGPLPPVETGGSIRGHAYQWRLRVRPQDWGGLLSRAGLSFDSRPGLPGQSGLRIRYKGLIFDFFVGAVCVYLSEEVLLLRPSALDCDRLARSLLLGVLGELEAFGFDFHLAGSLQVSLVRSEYAEVGNELAKDYMREKKALLLEGSDGKAWLKIDHSKGLPELETVHPNSAQVDMDEAVRPFFEDLRRDPCTLSDLKAEIKHIAIGMQTLIEHDRLLVNLLTPRPEPEQSEVFVRPDYLG